jgi:hypothetical protein
MRNVLGIVQHDQGSCASRGGGWMDYKASYAYLLSPELAASTRVKGMKGF